MPYLTAKVKGKGNGIQTAMVNMIDVTKALNWLLMYHTRYFGCKLGAQTQSDVKMTVNIVGGSHEVNKQQDMLDGFKKSLKDSSLLSVRVLKPIYMSFQRSKQ
jgi:translation initiation factor 5